MIYEFNFSNFKSYRSEVTIDFTAKPITEFEGTLIKTKDGKDLLPVCAIYGPNGGGKSSVLLAIKKLRELVTEPFIQLAFMKNKSEKLADSSLEELQDNMKATKEEEYFYKWDDISRNDPTKFGIFILINDKKYKYELSILNSKIQEENLFLENLANGEIYSVFERDSDGIYLCEEIKGVDIDKINEGLPLLAYISLFKDVEIIDNVISFFLNMQTVNFDNPSQDRKIMINTIEKDKIRILKVITSMGIDICDIRVERDSEGKILEVFTKHKLDDNNYKELKFYEESSGTRKIFSILPVILRGIDTGRFFIIDELDAKLHPALLRRIIELFTNPEINTHGAQLLFTSHDLTTMNNEVFRRDEIWFSAINGYNESSLYSLVDFKKNKGDKPRKDESYNKQYLEGRYGADPYLKCLNNWEVMECH